MAKLRFDLPRLRRNLSAVDALCRSRGLTFLPVTKVFQSRPDILAKLAHPALSRIADVNVANLERLDPESQTERVLLRPLRKDAARIARSATRVFLSDPGMGRILSQARLASGSRIPLKAVLMLEGGDLRDGVPLEQAAEVIRALEPEKGLEVSGVAVNLGCLAGALPTEKGLDRIVGTLRQLRRATGLPLETLSIGGTVFWEFVRDRPLPPEVTELRIGEAFCFGWNTSRMVAIPDLDPDVFAVELEVLEIWEKRVPGDEPESLGFNAFGERPKEPFSGPRLRAVLDGGENVAPYRSLFPLHPGVVPIGATHEYLVLDCTDAFPPVSPGEILIFRPGYEAVARHFLSPFKDLELGE